LFTRIEAVPALAINSAETAPLREDELTTVVGRAVPFQWITDCEQKFAPDTARRNASPPAVAEAGATEAIEGAGSAELIEKVLAADDPALQVGVEGFTTRTATVAGCRIRGPGTVSVSDVALTKIGDSATPPQST
jgi:hypothetical protein